MGKIKRSLNQSINNSKKIPLRYKKNNSTSLSILLTTGAYKKRIKDLMRNNRSLAYELDQSRIQVAAQKELLKDCVKNSNHMMYARAKLKDIAVNIHKLVTDLDVVMGFLGVCSHLKNIKYEDGFHQQDMRMKIANPVLDLIEETSSIEVDTTTTDHSTILDAAATSSTQPDNSPLPNRIDEPHKSPVSGGTLSDIGSPVDDSHLSLTPVLDIQPIVSIARCSASRNSRLSLKSAKTKVSESFPLKRTPQLLKKKSTESKESAMQNSKDIVKIQKFLSSPSKVTQLVSKTNALLDNTPAISNRDDTFDPASFNHNISLAQNILSAENKHVSLESESSSAPLSMFSDKINHTLVMCEDMELTDVIPSIPTNNEVSVDTQSVPTVAGESHFQDSSKSSAPEKKIMQSKHKNNDIPEYGNEITSERKSPAVDSPMVYNQRTSISSKKGLVDEKSVVSNGNNGIGIKAHVVIDGLQTLPLVPGEQNADTEQSTTIQVRENAGSLTSIPSIEKNSVVKGENNKITVIPQLRLKKQIVLESEELCADVSNTALLKTDMQKVSGMKCAGRKKPSKGNSLEPDNEKQMHDKTHLISCNLQSNRKKNSSCQETDMNQRSKRSKNVQYQVFFSSDSDTDTSVSTPPSTTKPRRFSTSKSKRVTVIHKPRVTPKSNSSNCSKQELGRSFLEADTEMKAVGNFKTTDSSFLPDTALSLNKNSSQEPDQDTYDFDSSNPKMKRVFAENCGNAMLGIKSDASVSDKKLNSKKFFPSKQNHKKDVSVTNIADSFPRSHSENDKNLEKCNSNWTKPNTIEEANVSSDSVDSERELNPLERKRVSFATLDSVYKFQRNSAVIYCDKRKTVQCTKNNVSSDSEESSASELDGEKPVMKGKEGKVLSLPEGIKKGQHTVKKATNESAKNHVMQSKELGQCLKDKTLEVDPHSLMHYVATNGEMDLDDETEIYTFVPSEQQEVEKTDSADCNASMITMHRSKNHKYSNSFDISNTNIQVSHASKIPSKPAEGLETKKLLVENSVLSHSASLNPNYNSTNTTHTSHHTKNRVKNVKLGSNGKIIEISPVNEHNKDILCSKVTNAESDTDQNMNDEEDKSVTGLASLISQLKKGKKSKTILEKCNNASKDRVENVTPAEDILISDKVKKVNCRKKSILPRNTSGKNVKQSKTPKHRKPLKEKNDYVLKKVADSLKCDLGENKKSIGLTTEQIETKAIPESCPNLEQQQNSAKDSKMTQEVKKLSSVHPDQDMKTNDENIPAPRSSLTDDRPKRRSKPVCYTEPNLNKKMRREL